MVVLSRNLKLMRGGREFDVPIRIHLPSTKRIIGNGIRDRLAGSRKAEQSRWIDSVQALLIAMQKIGVDLYAGDAHHSGNLKWERPGGGYGFPLQSAVQDLYEGDDKSM
jgi:hypothetical protein